MYFQIKLIKKHIKVIIKIHIPPNKTFQIINSFHKQMQNQQGNIIQNLIKLNVFKFFLKYETFSLNNR